MNLNYLVLHNGCQVTSTTMDPDGLRLRAQLIKYKWKTTKAEAFPVARWQNSEDITPLYKGSQSLAVLSKCGNLGQQL